MKCTTCNFSFFPCRQILADYPEELRGDVSLHLHKEVLSLPIFETASEGCKKLLSVSGCHLKSSKYTYCTYSTVAFTRLLKLSISILVKDKDKLLRARGIPRAQGRRLTAHLLPLQRFYGSAAGRHGRRHSGYVLKGSSSSPPPPPPPLLSQCLIHSENAFRRQKVHSPYN